MFQQIRVFLVPTVDCIYLNLIAVRLNAVQQVYKFFTLDPLLDESALRLTRSETLLEVSRNYISGEESQILSSYIGHRDWVSQLISYARAHCIAQTGKEFRDSVDLAIAIGAGIYVEDRPSTIYYFDAELDAWSCLYDREMLENTKVSFEESLKREHHAAAAVISLTAFEPVFGKPYYQNDIGNRANVARFLVENIAHFLGARSYKLKLARDHSEKQCVMETGVGGGDSKKGYLAHGLCTECLMLLKARESEERLCERTHGRYFGEVTDSLRAICDSPGRWETFARISKFLQQRAIPFLFFALVVSLVINLLASWDTHADVTLSEYAAKHIPALEVMFWAVMLFVFGLIIVVLLFKRVPFVIAASAQEDAE